MGPLVLGEAVPVSNASSGIVIFDPEVCQYAVDEGYVIDPGLWLANYEPARSLSGSDPFAVSVVDGRLAMIEVTSPEIRTSEGVGYKSSLADLQAAYGSRLEPVPDYGMDTIQWVVHEEAGDLYFDVLKEEKASLYPSFDGEAVTRFFAAAKGLVPRGGYTFGLGVCFNP